MDVVPVVRPRVTLGALERRILLSRTLRVRETRPITVVAGRTRYELTMWHAEHAGGEESNCRLKYA